MKPKISIIIPCYNVEKYIERCAKSLVDQTIGIEDLELIFVNDASTDSTLSMLLEIEKAYPNNILVINSLKNGKQGTAKNIGMQYATADYIGFVDSDDWIECDMYEKLYSKIKEYNCDFAGCCFVQDYRNGKSIETANGEDIFLKINTNEERKDFLNLDLGGGVVSKLYRKSLITDNQIFFPEQLKYEDNYWYSMIKLYVTSVYILKENLYHYCINPGSTVQSVNAPHHLDRLKIEVMKLDAYKEKGVFDTFHSEIELEFLNLFYINTLFILFTKFAPIPVDVIYIMQKTVLELFPNYKNNSYFIDTPSKYHPFLNTIDINWDEDQWNKLANKYKEIINNRTIINNN
ncbi:glycosyltransferase family 2 protein [Clostridium sp. UBA4548]|uniref:glycosyltransferase family 2 protein n=1 Tax=Clostridium sp. UBA4548 TaxID=1946361 RepID=UPI0025C319EC|nr:glycosyltransferase family 2 protein [Clostridium sp. UBA4548]